MSTRDSDRASISVIVPAWHDAAKLATLLPRLAAMDSVYEVIVAVAGEDGRSREIAASAGATFVQCKQPSRGSQMNVGAAVAHGDILLFNHADTDLTEAHVHAVAEALANSAAIGGAFYRKYDVRHKRLMWLESVARFLSRHGGTLFGDQSLFVRRTVFGELGGFASLPLMEDVEFSRRLRAAGAVVVLDPPIGTCSRRHDRRGAWRTSIQNALFLVLYRLGVSAERLHAWYYRDAEAGAAITPPEAQLDSIGRVP